MPGAFTIQTVVVENARTLRVVYARAALVNAALTDPTSWEFVDAGTLAPAPFQSQEVLNPGQSTYGPFVEVVLDNDYPTTPNIWRVRPVGAIVVAADDGTPLTGFCDYQTPTPRAVADVTLEKVALWRAEIGKRRNLDLADPTWEAATYTAGLLDDLVGGCRRAALVADLAATDGIGTTVGLDPGIPWLLERPLGKVDGANTDFWTQQPFDGYSLEFYVVGNGNALAATEWHSPTDRLVRLRTPPAAGAAVAVRYTPLRGLLRCGREVWCFDSGDPVNNTVDVLARARLGTTAADHAAGTEVHDVWGVSAAQAARYASDPLTASGNELNRMGRSLGVVRPQSLFADAAFRRAIVNVGVQPKQTLQAFDLALRYLYPDLWPYTTVAEDVRWPHRVVVWVSPAVVRTTAAYTPECWEPWLDEALTADTLPGLAPQGRWYVRGNALADLRYTGYYLRANVAEVGLNKWSPFLGGVPFGALGPVLPVAPPPGAGTACGTTPEPLRRVLPAGCGILVIAHP